MKKEQKEAKLLQSQALFSPFDQPEQPNEDHEKETLSGITGEPKSKSKVVVEQVQDTFSKKAFGTSTVKVTLLLSYPGYRAPSVVFYLEWIVDHDLNTKR